MRIYVAGAISGGIVADNVHVATEAATRLLNAGHSPFLPHLSVVWQMISGHIPYETWMEYDFAWIDVCDAVVRIPGFSPGGDCEVEYAREKGIPVYFGVDSFLEAAHI
jgi:nucleoside 2-deoxyribosyltransferase